MCQGMNIIYVRYCKCDKVYIYTHYTRFLAIILKGLDPLRAKETFIRKKLGHTMVSAIKASSVTL